VAKASLQQVDYPLSVQYIGPKGRNSTIGAIPPDRSTVGHFSQLLPKFSLGGFNLDRLRASDVTNFIHLFKKSTTLQRGLELGVLPNMPG